MCELFSGAPGGQDVLGGLLDDCDIKKILCNEWNAGQCVTGGVATQRQRRSHSILRIRCALTRAQSNRLI